MYGCWSASPTNAAWHARLVQIRDGHPNDTLKLFQLGHLRLQGFAPGKPAPAPDDPRRPALTARLNRTSATAYAVMGGHDEATRCLTEAYDRWAPRDGFERASADLDTARIQLDLGQLDAAEHSAANAVLAEVHLQAGEPYGLTLAHEAITKVKTLQSVAVRRDLLFLLAAALEARPGTETQELAPFSPA